MEVKDVKLSEIRPYENNPRFNDDAVEAVANSIQEFGFKQPIVVDSEGVIIVGHTRYKAAQELGLETVPVLVADDLTEDQVKAYRLADNKVGELATWDYQLLLEEIDDIELDMSAFGFLESGVDWDDVPDLEEDTYQEPEHDMLRCPSCGHIDRKEHFVKQ